jgi:hypothetical protein
MTKFPYWHGQTASPEDLAAVCEAYRAALAQLALPEGDTEQHRHMAAAVMTLYDLGIKDMERLVKAAVTAGFRYRSAA